MDLEEELEEFAERDDFGIEHDLHGLGVIAVVSVCGVGDITAGVADASRDDAGTLA
jgi:hypothetical protein